MNDPLDPFGIGAFMADFKRRNDARDAMMQTAETPRAIVTERESGFTSKPFAKLPEEQPLPLLGGGGGSGGTTAPARPSTMTVTIYSASLPGGSMSVEVMYGNPTYSPQGYYGQSGFGSGYLFYVYVNPVNSSVPADGWTVTWSYRSSSASAGEGDRQNTVSASPLGGYTGPHSTATATSP